MGKTELDTLNECDMYIQYTELILKFCTDIKEFRTRYHNFSYDNIAQKDFREKTVNLLEPEYSSALATNRFLIASTSSSYPQAVIHTSIKGVDGYIDDIKEAHDILFKIKEGLHMP